MEVEELNDLIMQGIFSGLWEGVKILAPYFIGLILIYLAIAVIKKHFRKKKK